MLITTGHHEVHLRDYFYILRKRRAAILLFALLSLSVGVLFTVSEKVLYQATATILIERDNPNVVDFKEVMAMDASSTDYYQTQFLMLESETLIDRLIGQKDVLKDPYFRVLQEGFVRRWMAATPSVPDWLRQFFVEKSPSELFIKKMLDIKPVRNSRLVKVRVKHPDPKRAADLTNALVRLFIERSLEDRFDIATQATQMIAGQIDELKAKVVDAERRLQQYKEDNDLVNIPSIREKDEFLQDAKLELVKIQAEEAKLSKRYLPAHPKRIHIRSQIEGLEEKINEEERKMFELGNVAVDYSQLEREAESARKIYETLLARLEETTSEAKTQASNILIVDKAVPPPRPVTPRPVLNMLIAAFVGTVGGILLAFFYEYLDSTVRIPDDVEKGVGLDLFGIIPKAGRGQAKSSKVKDLLFDPAQPTPTAEAFRALRTALLFKLRQVSGCRTLLVTSPNPGEGKSTISLNLAAAFQQNHLKVLLVDADLRRPRLHKALGVEPEKGFTEILEGESTHEPVIYENVQELGFDFLSSGTRSHHPTELLGGKYLPKLMTELKKRYDLIIFDSAPYLAVADVVVLSEFVDAIVIAARYHQTDRRHLRQIHRRFGADESKTVGVVINQVSVREKDYYYQQYYYYGYGDEAPKK